MFRLRSLDNRLALVLLLVGGTFITGCHLPAQRPFYLHDDGDLSHYVGVATDIEYPDTQTVSLDDVTNAEPPLTLENPTPREMWDVSLEEAVRLTLANSKVMRSLGGRFASTAGLRAQTGEAPDAIVTRPDGVQTIYDPAITESSPFGGGTLGVPGVEAALAAFDAQYSTSAFWNHNDRPQNVSNNGQFSRFFARVFQQDQTQFQQQISKTTATGGNFSVRNNITYDANNNPTRQIYSDWNLNFETAFTQPLLSGSGVQYNRIAGPNSPFTGVGTLQFDGVMLARINTDISLADFEGGVRNMVYDAENTYWELYFAYRQLEASKSGRASALQTWKKVHALYLNESKGGEADKEAQAREQYFSFRSQVQQALNDLYRAENRLRYMMGLAVSDGRLIRPSDEPTTAHVVFDWYEVHAEGLSRSVELRRQRWRIKERELELIAARSLLQPRLDAVGTYRWLGLGDTLLQSHRSTADQGLLGTNAFQELTSGKYQEWQLGFQGQIPIGFRRELSGVRHYQLQLARERGRLQDQELEVSHEIGDAIRNLHGNYELAQTNFNRRVAAEKQVEAVEAAYTTGTVTLDLLLEAQRRRSDAEIAYYRSLTDYMRGISQVHYRKGSLLEYDGVYLAEGPWPQKAYFDAERMAHQRDASYYFDYGYTRPKVISQGTYLQNAKGGFDGPMLGDESSSPEMFDGTTTETLPTPAPRQLEEVPATPQMQPQGPAPESRMRQPTRTFEQPTPQPSTQRGTPRMRRPSGERIETQISKAVEQPRMRQLQPAERVMPRETSSAANEDVETGGSIWGDLGLDRQPPKSRLVRSQATDAVKADSQLRETSPVKTSPGVSKMTPSTVRDPQVKSAAAVSPTGAAEPVTTARWVARGELARNEAARAEAVSTHGDGGENSTHAADTTARATSGWKAARR